MHGQPDRIAPVVVVVGAGAAGQVAGIAAAEEGCRVVVLEQMDRPGLKLLASGGGHANLTNTLPVEEIQAAFGREGRFMAPALEVLGPAGVRELFARLGVPTVVMGGGCVFPASQRAADVQAALRRRMEQLGVTVLLERAATALCTDAGRVAGVQTAGGERFRAERVILACGGRSWPSLGGTGGGYDLARQAGHTIVEPTPALVPLVARERWPARLAGVSLPAARIWIALPGQGKAGVIGEVLWTHRGVSGPAVLDISGAVAELLARGPVPLRIEPVAGMDAAGWAREIDARRGTAGRRHVANTLRDMIPASLAQVACELAGLAQETTAAQLPAAGREALARVLAAMELTITATEGFEAAFVTRGGVKLKEVDPATLQSRRLPGLYLAGELLDLDGPTGGFNLQWAFASGHLAGESAALPGG